MLDFIVSSLSLCCVKSAVLSCVVHSSCSVGHRARTAEPLWHCTDRQFLRPSVVSVLLYFLLLILLFVCCSMDTCKFFGKD